ncbi:hypothetical protein QQ045_032170 [Rhodiola kirilowii]
MEEMKKEFHARIRVLEELVVRGGSANLANNNASEGSWRAYESYHNLIGEAQTPLYRNCEKHVLETILRAMQMKVESRLSDKGFNKMLKITKEILPHDNIYPVCGEPRYAQRGSRSDVPKKTVKYFPLTPRLQRLYMTPHTARQMRWHAVRKVNVDEYIRHPADGESWKTFDKDYPEFASEIRNVRLGLATDGFNHFGASGLSHSTWPIVLIPYNLPPHICMKKEMNILSMLISGPKSPGKCLNVFMRPLIDELKELWEQGVCTYDRHDGSSFTMKAAVLWTISDFPGLGMLGGLKTKGYKACPSCLDEIDATHLFGRMSYQGHRRWLPKDHSWRFAANRFNGKVESRDPPKLLSGPEVFHQLMCHEYPTLNLHPQFKPRATSEKLCWTHVSSFYELPYWHTLIQPYSLDVMHIEKDVFDNIIGTILGLEGKTKDDIKARKGLEELGVRRKLWFKPTTSGTSRKEKVSKAPYTVTPSEKLEILELIKDVKYPSGYAGTLKSKINLDDKKFIGLKTHDCHVMLQRMLPVYIRLYLPPNVISPLIALSHWFRRLCCREFEKEEVHRLKVDIVHILCQLERIFPPSFCTIMAAWSIQEVREEHAVSRRLHC